MARLVLQDLKVRSLDLDYNEITWKASESTDDVLDYTFQVVRSESPLGPFEELGPIFEDRFIFVDNAIPAGHRWRQLFYKIICTHKASGEKLELGPLAKEPPADLIALELRRHFQLLMHEFNGRRCWVLPVRTFGKRCECWNSTQKTRTRSGCRLCYDVGFIRGYLAPIEVWMQIDPSPKTDQHIGVAKTQQSNTTARIGYYPPLKPDDLLVEAENRRWRVTKVAQTEKGRAVVHQELELHEIPDKSIEFTIPLKMEDALKDLWLSPARNYSNPHNLESLKDEELPNIFSLYRPSIPEPNK